MNKIVIDFETYCDLDIKKVGLYKYATHPSCHVICMAYKINDTAVQLWAAADAPPTDLQHAMATEHRLYAFNAAFEYFVWNTVGVKQEPELFKSKSLSFFVDVKALCARFRMPQNLKNAAIAFSCATEKLSSGTQLIRQCCTPKGYPSEQNYQDLYTYCKGDVQTTHEILQALPATRLTDQEQLVWEQTQQMNERGVPIDIKAVDSIIFYLSTYMSSMRAILPEVTNGAVSTPGQIQKIKAFCARHGVQLDNLQADTVTETLKRTDLPEDVRTLLEIRQLTGMSSVKKFLTIKEMYNNGYVQGNLNYHGAGTGRWSGYGFQYHNLPRAKRKDPEKWIQRFINREEIEKPVQIAKALIRPMIKAPKDYKIIVSDFSSIENRVLAWVNKDHGTLDLLAAGRSQYKDMASYLFSMPYDEVSKDSYEYQLSKMIVLGCGFQMGAKRFRAVASTWGIELTEAEASEAVGAYRAKYTLIVRGWRNGATAARTAVRYPGKAFKALDCVFAVRAQQNGRQWLRITLPSGRALMYADPKLEEDKYGLVVKYTGLNATIHKMQSLALPPGLITENVVQAVARDILAAAQLRLAKQMPEVQLSISVHDETGGLIPESMVHKDTLDKFNTIMCEPLPWAQGLPLAAAGYIAQRYKKD